MNIRKILLLVIVIQLAGSLYIHAGAPEVLWEKTIGDDGVDISFSVADSPHDGLALVGFKRQLGDNRGDLFLIQTNSDGEVIRESLLLKRCTGTSIKRTADGGYIICGIKSHPLVTESTVLVKTDELGNVEWNYTYYDTGGYQANDVAVVSRGGYVVTGIRWKGLFEIVQDLEHQEPDAFLIRVDEQGEVLWNRTYGGLYDDRGFSVIETNDSGFLLAGSSRPDDESLDMGFLVKTDSMGEVEWSQTYGGEEGQQLQSVCMVEDGGYAAAGFTLSFDSQGADYYLVRVNEGGQLLWSNHYGGSGDDEAYDLVATSYGGFVLVGGSSVAMGSDRDVGVVRTDSDGGMLCDAAYGGGDHDIGYSIYENEASEYIIVGETKSFGLSTQIYLLKLNVGEENLPSETIPGYPLITILFSLFSYSILFRSKKKF